MCGFLISNSNINKNTFLKISLPLKERGPDDENYIFLQDEKLHLIHYRLSIINPQESIQPMFDHSKKYIILFNGLIYNFLEIQEELKKFGIKFLRKNSDTEVLLEAYKFWGDKCLQKIDGMFAFVIIDRNKKKIFIARDKFGEKPLYYKIQNEEIFISSNLKTIKEFKQTEINSLSLSKYLYYGYIPQPNTIFKNISKIPPGSFLNYDLTSKKIEKNQKFFDFSLEKNILKKSDDNKIELENLLKKAIKSRSITDVPIGTFLSGGLDSSIIAKIKSEYGNLNTFSMAFEDNTFDESKYAREISKYIGSDHHEFKIKINNIFNDLNILQKIDEPISDTSLIPTTKLCYETSKNVKSVISGDGADELQYGYEIFQAQYFAKIISKILPKSIIKKINLIIKNSISYSNRYMSFEFKIKKFLDGLEYNKNEWVNEWMKYSDVDFINKLTGNNYLREEILSESYDIFSSEKLKKFNFNEIMSEYFIKMYFCNNILTKVDRAGMQNGLETRMIFTEPNLFNFLFSINPSQKGNFFEKKILLKKTFKSKLPENIVSRKKHGFAYPILNAIEKLHKEKYFENISFFDQNLIDQKVHEHFDKKIDNKLFLWSLVNLKEYFN